MPEYPMGGRESDRKKAMTSEEINSDDKPSAGEMPISI